MRGAPLDEPRRYPELNSVWKPAPKSYWDHWREEIDLADRIIVNSEWSRDCLQKEIGEEKKSKLFLLFTNIKSLRKIRAKQIKQGRVKIEISNYSFLARSIYARGLGVFLMRCVY